MTIQVSIGGAVDSRPVYADENELKQNRGYFNTLFEDGEGKFILFPDGFYEGVIVNYLVFKLNGTGLMLVNTKYNPHTPVPIKWPLRPASRNVVITISGDA